MSDNIVSAVLTFSLLVVVTAAIGSERVTSSRAAPARTVTSVVMLPTVTIIGHRAATTKVAVLPAIVVTGHRAPVAVAYEPRANATPGLE